MFCLTNYGTENCIANVRLIKILQTICKLYSPFFVPLFSGIILGHVLNKKQYLQSTVHKFQQQQKQQLKRVVCGEKTVFVCPSFRLCCVELSLARATWLWSH